MLLSFRALVLVNPPADAFCHGKKIHHRLASVFFTSSDCHGKITLLDFIMSAFNSFQTEQQLDHALDLMRRLPPQQIEKNLSDLIDLVSKLSLSNGCDKTDLFFRFQACVRICCRQ